MTLEYENRTTVIGKFGDVCQGPLVDWRHKCKDEIIMNTPMVLADNRWQDLPYEAIIFESSSINFRDPFEFEGGNQEDCDPSTANVDTVTCNFVLPNLQTLSIGTQSLHYFKWRDTFCEKFPEYRGFSPFVVSNRGTRITFRQTDNSDAMMTFAGHVNGELSKSIWDHIYRTYWVGDEDKVDQFDGLLRIYEEGISNQGTCDDYPLTPTCINMAEYILGTAAVDAGGTVGPGDVVLAVGDPNRPGDAPADNIVVIYAGTMYETTLDITGFDTIDLMTAWYELVTNEWGIDVIQWMIGVGKNQTRCLAEVAACKQACSGGDCRQLLVSDSRDTNRADREAAYIRNRSVELYPYTETTIPMLQSPALRTRNKILFMPWRFDSPEGPANTLLWVWRDQRAADAGLFRDVPMLMDGDISYGPPKTTTLHDGSEFGDISRAFGQRAFSWLHGQDKNCYQWWNNMETALVGQLVQSWLCVDGVSCDSVITLPCVNSSVQVEIVTCTADTPNLVYTFTFDNSDTGLTLTTGKKVRVANQSGSVVLAGEITTVTDTGDTADITITLDAVGPYADCTWDGEDLGTGGKLVIHGC